MLIAVNQTRQYQIQMRQHLDEAKKRINEIQEAVQMEIREVNEIVHMLTAEMLVSELEGIGQLYYAQRHRQVSLRQSAEAGHLTAEMIPKDELAEIFGKLQSTHQAMPVEWYYVHARVDVLPTAEGLTFVAELPLVEAEVFLAYGLKAFPVQVGKALIQLNVHSDIVIGTESGNVYTTMCQDKVCKAGVQHKGKDTVCEETILQGKPVETYCEYQVLNYKDFSYDVSQIDDNLFVIVLTKSEKYNYRCTGSLSESGELNVGTYLIYIDTNCIMETIYWRIDGVYIMYINETIQWNVFPQTLNIPNSTVDVLEMPHWNNLSMMHHINQLDIQKVDVGEYINFKRTSHILFYVIGSIVLGSILSIGFGIFICRIRQREVKTRTKVYYKPTNEERNANDEQNQLEVESKDVKSLWPKFGDSLTRTEI